MYSRKSSNQICQLNLQLSQINSVGSSSVSHSVICVPTVLNICVDVNCITIQYYLYTLHLIPEKYELNILQSHYTIWKVNRKKSLRKKSHRNKKRIQLDWLVCETLFYGFNSTFNNISVILWQSVLLVKATRIPGENHRSAASH